MMKLTLTMLMVFFILVSGSALLGEELKPETAKAMEAAGFTPYPGSVFCTGMIEQGMRFASSDSPEDVREWFVESLAGWNLQDIENLGLWSLYDGPAEINSTGQIFAFNNVTVKKNADLPEWHNLSDNMTTEILVALPRWNSGNEADPLLEIPPLEKFNSVGMTSIPKPDGISGSLDQAD